MQIVADIKTNFVKIFDGRTTSHHLFYTAMNEAVCYCVLCGKVADEDHRKFVCTWWVAFRSVAHAILSSPMTSNNTILSG